MTVSQLVSEDVRRATTIGALQGAGFEPRQARWRGALEVIFVAPGERLGVIVGRSGLLTWVAVPCE